MTHWGPVHLIANWKMHGTTQYYQRLLWDFFQGYCHCKDVIVHLCPPFPYLSLVGHMCTGRKVSLGAQNMFFETQGPFTGEVGPVMLQDLGCDLVILGHTERRFLCHESNAMIGQKIVQALKHDLTPVLCVGETWDQHQKNHAFATVYEQLHESLASVPYESSLFVAYEPTWAIGTNQRPTPETVETLLAQLEAEPFLQQYDIRFLYGGSVDEKNIQQFLSQPLIHGALVGSASLKAKTWLKVIQEARQALHQPKGLLG